MRNQYSLPDMVKVASDKDKEIPELQAQVAKMRKALEEIAEVPKHFQTSDTLYGFIELLFSKINSNRNLAREALKDLPPT